MGSYSYAVDIVFCIDCSGSMDPIINLVKENALSFHDQLTGALRKEQKSVDQVRVKVLGFGGYEDEPPQFSILDFVQLPQEATKLRDFVGGLKTMGGNDELGLEALALAISSKWETGFTKRRHIIVVYTDEPPHALGSGTAPGLAEPMPRSLEELKGMWDQNMKRSDKRLVLFTNESDQPWPQIADSWDNAVWQSLDFEQPDMTSIIRALVNSIQ